MHPLVNIAITAARKAGNIILQAVTHLDTLQIEHKGASNYVTQIDKACEQEIIYIIRKAYPQHIILAEESGLLAPEKPQAGTEITWIIDPLDGTTNFIHGFPTFCVSIAIRINNQIEHGVIFDPMRDELFISSKGRGVQMNNRRLRVSQTIQMNHALLGAGFANRIPLYQPIFEACPSFRCTGSVALDLAYVAAGRFDGFFESNLKIWDMAAASLMIQEAGGLISDSQGRHHFLESGDVIAGNPKIYQSMMSHLR